MIQIKDLTFSQYFAILDILNKDQYTYTQNAKGKMVQSHEPVKKHERTDEFMFNLYSEIVKQMCGLSDDFLQDETFILLCWDLISEKLNEINELIAYDELDEINDTFDFEGEKIGYKSFENWTFNKWVVLENALKGTTKKLENGTTIVEHGAKFLLPICFGEWVDSMPDFQRKYEFFNNTLLAKDIALVFAKVNNWINALKQAHQPMYSTEPSDGGGGVAYKTHVEMFGWQETLKNLAEKRVFGDYLQLKQAPLLEVLEYLNCSVSAEIAKEKDFNAANRKT